METKCNAQSAFVSLCTRIWLALVCTVGTCVEANTITVTNTNHSGPGSLRQVLVDANDGDTINFAVTARLA
jgi:hypothetical protein